MSAPVVHSLDPRGVATLLLNRPEVGNAYNSDMIEGLLAALDGLAVAELRALLLKGAGKHFQAGADLDWVRVEGTLRFATDANTRMRVATILVPDTGTLQIGGPTDRVRADRTARIVFVPPATCPMSTDVAADATPEML